MENKIPKEYYKADLESPVAEDVGSLINLLNQLPSDLVIQQGWGEGVSLSVYNIKDEDVHLRFTDTEDE